MTGSHAITIALAQSNFTVGDIRGNVARIVALTQEAAAKGADLVVFPEMAITGYPAEDLLFKSVFQHAAMKAVDQLAEALKNCPAAALVGGYEVVEGMRYNATFLIEAGGIVHRQYKRYRPNYGVFDEKRLFARGPVPEPCVWRGIRLGILICEDVWREELALHLAAQGAELLIVQNASPYEMGKASQRKAVISQTARATGLPVIYVNLVGGQDELVFDGRSHVVNAQGEDVVRCTPFAEEVVLTHWDKNIPDSLSLPNGSDQTGRPLSRALGRSPKEDKQALWRCAPQPFPEPQGDMETIYQAMVVGLRDYVNKNGFKGVVIGLSGGIDSGLTAAVAVDALGADRVAGLIMPSPYTSDESIEDAEAIAQNLGIVVHSIAIDGAMQTFDAMLKPVFGDAPSDTTEENIQARIRGNLLMAVSNKLGYMVLTTGNKSEMSVGYATLYGDMCGGYSVLKDVYKTTVFALSRWRNSYAGGLDLLMGPICQEPAKAARPFDRSHSERQIVGEKVIPERMITKPPSAELKPNQKDEDSLPPYAVLDAILHGLIEQRRGVDELVAEGFDAAIVERVAKMIYVAEYKRRQSPPGVKVSGMAFGRDRRYPITNQWIWQRRA